MSTAGPELQIDHTLPWAARLKASATGCAVAWGEIEPNLRAIDIWIGAAEDLQICLAEPAVTAIVIDPLASNTRAHKFYRRLGFVPEGRRMFGDDDCLVHRLTRLRWHQRFPND